MTRYRSSINSIRASGNWTDWMKVHRFSHIVRPFDLTLYPIIKYAYCTYFIPSNIRSNYTVLATEPRLSADTKMWHDDCIHVCSSAAGRADGRSSGGGAAARYAAGDVEPGTGQETGGWGGCGDDASHHRVRRLRRRHDGQTARQPDRSVNSLCIRDGKEPATAGVRF